MRWFLSALALLTISSLWFGWLQPLGPLGPPPPRFLSPGWLWHPREQNAHRRLPRVPGEALYGCHFTNNLGWVVGDSGLILHTADGGRSWRLQTNIVWRPEDPTPTATKASDRVDTPETVSPIVPLPSAPDLEPKDKAANVDTRQQPPVADDGKLQFDAAKLEPNKGVQPPTEVAPPPTETASGETTPGVTPPTPQELPVPSLWDLCFVDAARGWVVGDSGTILHTGDGGQNWTNQLSGVVARLSSVAFVDAAHGWAVGEDGTILHTGDGGQTWTNQLSEPNGAVLNLSSVAFVDSARGWAVGAEGTILHTGDGGQTWTNQLSGAVAHLSSVAFVGPRRGWAVGGAGTILRTEDGGRSWAPQARATLGLLTSVEFVDAERGWALAQGVLLRTEDGGQTWTRPATNMDLVSLAFVDAHRGWAVARVVDGEPLYAGGAGQTRTRQIADTNDTSALDSSTAVGYVGASRSWMLSTGNAIFYTEDGGQTWAHQATDRNLVSIAFRDAQHGWAVSMRGAVVRTVDGGTNWTPQTAGTDVHLLSVAFADAQRGWAVGAEGRILHTEDGGQTWTPQTASTNVPLLSVAFADTQRGWAVGSEGTILHTGDGGKQWTRQASRTDESLCSVAFVDDQHGWAVGSGGTILHTGDGGATWDPQLSGTLDYLYSVTFVNDQRGWVVGDGETILHTSDGGQTWADPRRYRRDPAPLFYPVLAVVGLMAWQGLRRRTDAVDDDPTVPRSIADHAVSDSPLTSRDHDALNFDPLAEGLANFLRNEKTTGPLTLAVTGNWGTGKSSIMGLVKEKLEARGWRPVWFNAWHHEQEEQLLAGLLESIRSQAVPPWFSWTGLGFRLRLVSHRLRQPRFAGIRLRKDTRTLLDRRPEGEGLRRLNRMLLEDALTTELAAPFVERVQQWAEQTWNRSRMFVLLGAVLACMAGGYYGARRILPTPPAQAEPPPAVWATNSVVAPDGLAAIVLESARGLRGATFLNNLNVTNWLSTQD